MFGVKSVFIGQFCRKKVNVGTITNRGLQINFQNVGTRDF